MLAGRAIPTSGLVVAETDVPALAPSASLRAAAIGAAMDEADMETLSASSTPAFGFHMPALGSAGAGMVLLNLSAALFGTNQAVIRSIVDNIFCLFHESHGIHAFI